MYTTKACTNGISLASIACKSNWPSPGLANTSSVITAPVINSPITGGSGIITGNFKNVQVSFNDKIIDLKEYANANSVSCVVLPLGDCSEFRSTNN